MAAEPMSDELTDEERIATKYVILSGKYDDLTGEQARAKAQELAPLVAAVRTTLPPPVRPLAWGEEVAIPDLPEIGFVRLRLGYNHTLIIDTGDSMSLDTAGVARLRETCDRWFAAQNETAAVRIGLQSAIGAEKA